MSGHLPADTMTGPGASSDGSWTLLPLATAPLHHGGCPPFLTLLPIFFVKGLGTGGGGGMGEAHTSGCVWEGCLGSRVSPCLPSIRSPFLLPTEPRFYSSLHPLFTQPRVSREANPWTGWEWVRVSVWGQEPSRRWLWLRGWSVCTVKEEAHSQGC